MNQATVITILVFLLYFSFFTVFINKTREVRTKPDYFMFFVMGVVWLLIGLAFKNHGFLWMGLLLTLFGLMKKKKWKENRVDWKNLETTQKQLVMVVIGGSAIIFLVGFTIFLLVT